MNRVSIIGCGAVAERLHIPALKSMENIDIKSIVDIDIDRAKQTASDFGIKIGTDEITPAEKEDEIAIITVPTGLHKEVTIKCLNKDY